MPVAGRSLLLAALAAACGVPQDPPPAAPPRPLDQEPHEYGVAPWGERLLIEPMVMPAVWLTRDVDDGTGNDDLQDGSGYGLRVAVGRRDQSIGLLYQGFHTDGDGFDAQTVGIDFDVRAPLDDGTPVFLRAGACIGVAGLEARGDDSLGNETAAQLRLGFDFLATEHLMFGASIGGIVFGHFGETEAYGTFLTFGATLVF